MKLHTIILALAIHGVSIVSSFAAACGNPLVC